MPERERSFAGYTFHQRLSVGFYGTVYRAVGGNHQEARILQIDPGLSQRAGFVEALERFGGDLGLLEHKNVQATVLVGRAPDGRHLVVNESSAGAVTVEQMLGDAAAAGKPLPAAVALAIGRAVVSGLTHAHSVGIVHGAVHPRSVLVDVHGGVKLADFAAARALAAAAAAADDPHIMRNKGYLAPELALGDPPSVSADVYAAGAFVHMLLAGSPPPGELTAPRMIGEVLRRALETEPSQRYPSAIEFRSALRAAVDNEGVAVATVKDLSNFVGDLRGAAEANLDAETEDVLASLAAEPQPAEGAPEPSAPSPRRSRAASVKGPSDSGLESALDDLVSGLPMAGNTPRPERTGATPDDDEDDDAPTAVDPQPQLSSDPVSALIRADGKSLPQSDPIVRLGSEADRDEDTYIPPALTDSDVELAQAARSAVSRSSRGRVASEPRLRAAALHRPPTGTDPVASVPVSRGGGGLWIAVLVIVGIAGGALLYSKMKDQPAPHNEVVQVGEGVKAGVITVTANEAEAAVWLKLGRTPVDTIPLSAAAVHQIRVEHEGYAPEDIDVLGSMWTGSGTQMRAVLNARLEPASPDDEIAAYPPAPQRDKTGREGRGTLRITSTPTGATAYVLVGFTPDVHLRDVQVGREYEFKIAKDGFAPGFVVIRAADWKKGDGTKRAVEGAAELAALPPKGRKKK